MRNENDIKEISIQVLAQKLNRLCEHQSFNIQWFLKDLNTGQSVHRDGYVIVTSASTRKIAILAAAMKAVHEGRFTLDQPVVMDAKYQDNTSGCFQHLQPGFEIQLRDALVMMIFLGTIFF